MSETDLGRALLKLDAAGLAGVPDARRQTWAVLERDRRRVRLLTAMTLAVWLLAVGLVVWVLIAFGLLMPKHAKLMKDVHEGRITEAVREQVQGTHMQMFAMTTVTVAFAVGVLALAALCTVVLLIASRRATLRQVNASLVEIAEQLKRLAAPAATPPGEP